MPRSHTNAGTTYLVVNVVVVRVVPAEPLQRVPREAIPAVVVDGLERGDAEEEHRLARAEVADLLRDERTERVDEEALERVVV